MAEPRPEREGERDMKPILRAGLATGAALVGIAPALHAHAGGMGSSGCSSCSVPKPCNCEAPTGHMVNVPGVNISPPTVTVNAPSIYVSGANVVVQSSSVSSAQSSASAEASSSASASGNAYANGAAFGSAYANALAVTNANSFALGGGGGNFSASEGVNSFIPSLAVEGVETGEARRICAEYRSTPRVVAVQAVCLDDKAIPHPASQVIPDRELLPAYEGEVFRCIAGARMQYTLADYAGSADFTRGQTVSCLKGEALYHSAAGQLACRPQRPARDCNERSLLRRYGAGIKVIRTVAAQQCVAYKTETAQSGAPESLLIDGGVGGVVR